MKVFVPVSDEMLAASGALSGELVPFDPDFLVAREGPCREGRKPANWISESDYTSARKRLRQSQLTD